MMKKRFLIFILALVMTLVFIPSIASAANTADFAGGNGTKADPYLISTTVQLYKVRNDLDAHYKLTCDIVFTDADFAEGGVFYRGGAGWRPIGTSEDSAFTGTLDGNGFAVKNLYINIFSYSSAVYVGLFGYNNGTVRNLGMVDGNISAQGPDDDHFIACAGGIAGINFGTITNCYNTGDISASSYPAYAGGIAGNNYKGTIENCYNTGTVSATTEDNDAYAGGIAGYNDSAIKNCHNTGTISATTEGNDAYAGGIAGYNSGTITGCYNTSTVSATVSSSSSSYAYVGGIAGYNAGGIAGYNDSAIRNCHNTGTVSATAEGNYAYAGGIAGYNSGTITGCYNTGTVSATAEGNYAYAGGIAGCNARAIKNCYNIGTVSATAEGNYAYAGGIVGRDYQVIIKNCYYLDTISKGVGYGTDTATKCTAEQMQLQSTFVGFDFAVTWGIYPDNEYKYPVLDILHTYERTTTKATDSENGSIVKTCSVCGDVRNYTVYYAKTFILSDSCYTYDGLEKTPTVTVKDAVGNTLTQGVDYTVTYADGRINLGTYTVTVEGIGNYNFTQTLTFIISTEFAGGSGTKADPYLIATPAHLNNVRKHLSAYFKLTCDIEFTEADFALGGIFYRGGAGWEPIGTSFSSPFIGTFDGNGFAVKNLYFHMSDDATAVYAGLFGYNKGTIENLGVVDGNLFAETTASSTQARVYVGGIAGYNTATIAGCYNTAAVSAGYNAIAATGGIAGWNTGTVTNCYNTGDILATTEAGDTVAAAGGIAGYNYGTTQNCYNIGEVVATAVDTPYAGGIVGCNYKTIQNCYYLDAISVGAGYGADTATKCTAEQMQLQSTYVDFDFDTMWAINANSAYQYPFIHTAHTYETTITKATDSENGSIVKTCGVCGKVTNTAIHCAETFTLSATGYTYNGSAKTPTVTVKDSAGKTLKKDTDYTVTYASGRINAGTYTVTVEGIGNYAFTKTLTFQIDPVQVDNCSMSLSATGYTYDGSTKTPTVIVKNPSGSKLTNGTSYTVSYPSGRVNAGTYTVTVTMKGNYTGTKTLTFKINPASLGTCKLSATSYTYNGSVKTPTVTVKNASGTTLTKNTSYTVTYASGRKNVGTYTVTIQGIGNYTGTKTLTFKINPASLDTCALSATSYTYNGSVKTPTVTVKNASGTTLTKDYSYTVTYASGRKNVGTYTVTIKGIGNYTGTRTLTFKINPAKASNCSIKLSSTAYTYDGNVKTPGVTVKSPTGSALTEGTSYTVAYSTGRVNVGTYKVIVTMKGNYTGTRTLTFKINPASLGACKLSATSYTYNGSVKTPSVTVKNASGTTLTKNTSYTVTYASGRKNVGTYKVTIKGKGNYSGTKTLTFKINPASLGSCKLSATSYIYNGSVKTPSVTVKNASGTTLTKNTSYTVTYASGRKNAGTYKVTIKGKGNYTGTKTLTFKIVPKAPSISKLTAKSKALTVTLNKQTTQTSGYEIQYATNKGFTSAKTTTVTNSTSTKTLSGLKAKTTYYVRVRAYKTVGGVKIYSAWSAAKYLKTK